MKLLTTIFIVLLSGTLAAQTMYGFSYRVYDQRTEQTTAYRAFLVRFDDGTGFARIHEDVQGPRREMIVNVTLSDYEETLPSDVRGGADTTYLLVTGSDAQVIKGKPVGRIAVHSFGFYYDQKEEAYLPWQVFVGDLDNDADEDIGVGEYDDMVLLTEKELTEELVSEFFKPEEEFYQALYPSGNVRPVAPQPAGNVTMHLIIVADTQDGEIGVSCERDRLRMQRHFKDIAGFLGVGFRPESIAGEDFTKQRVSAALQKLQPGPQDIVVFYYTGHGFYNTQSASKYPHMALRQSINDALPANSLGVEDVYRQIVAKGARFNLVLSDCCNNDPNSLPAVGPALSTTKSGGSLWHKPAMMALFLPQQRTSLLLTAASQGELATSNPIFGGFFSYHFKASLDHYASPFYSMQNIGWDRILKEATASTVKLANRAKCEVPGMGLRVCRQNPVCSINGRVIAAQ